MSSERDDLRRRLDIIESAYEYLLAYAAQGLPAETAGRDPGKTGKIRDELRALAAALDGLGPAFDAFAATEPVAAPAEHRDFHRVLEDDARRALAAIRLVI